MNDLQHLKKIIRHIKLVEQNCNLLAEKIFETDKHFALSLIIRGRTHDLSKFTPFEFNNLRDPIDPDFKDSLRAHQTTNSHHPEFFANINLMSNLDIAEMVCDCVARAQEFGTDVRKWFANNATEKYKFSMNDEIGIKITQYLDLLLPVPFEKVKK